ncbi:hypothetical protein BOTBODRAFT_177718 [Botryobasidium botryosum FD-172 SS1]|uniref:Phosphatidylglycerol/phosphatidylinositol transfer protein n=1 Tax=Botryobasidium botryosum (strain FD-172 SS1) TaxID=930990 RepID=A0A067M637_BOTB1|nr:hypothetical protein BOTBODRAFT_177718 [Botryobasidium botryosum FD-172 SS1]
MRLTVLSLLTLSLAASAAVVTRSAQKIGYDPGCSKLTDAFQIKSLNSTPADARPGDELTVDIVGTATKIIDNGTTLSVSVNSANNVHIFTKNFDFCSEAKKGNFNIQCPVQPGDVHFTHTFNLPSIIPASHYLLDVTGSTQDKTSFLCANLDVDFSS